MFKDECREIWVVLVKERIAFRAGSFRERGEQQRDPDRLSREKEEFPTDAKKKGGT